MVALIVTLKLTLLKNSLKRSVWRTVGLVLGMLYALGIVIVALVGLTALRFGPVDLAADVTVLVFAVLTLGWLLMSLLVFGVDETVDPAKFALLPVRARELLPGLFVSGLIGSPGVATVLVAAGLVLAWSRGWAPLLAAVVAVPIGVGSCVLLSRAGTAAFASFLSSRRFRDLAFVVLALFGAAVGIGGNLLGSVAQSGSSQLRQVLADTATVVGWTPFGWVWAVPADVARGLWWQAGVHLVLAVALVGVLWVAWGHLLAKRLIEPVEAGGGGSGRVKENALIDRLYPATPAGGVAARTLRYWRRDPRYLAGVAGLLIAPVVLVVTQLMNPGGSSVLAAFAPAVLGVLIGASIAQDLCYDGTALWLHVASGLRGADDRAGRVMSTLTIFGPVLVALLVVSMVATAEWSLLAPVVGLTIGLTLTGLGVGSFVGALWQWPAPPPGANPFQKGNSGGLPSLLSFSVASLGTTVLAVPTIAAAVGSLWYGWLGYLSVVVGLATGLLVLRIGIAQGGRVLDRRWPEVLQSVSERSA
ncbi:MAG: type transport system permease protein [Propionibacteriaceae bacterium]|nr:hypothetical protein [Propionibacteriaceae bacterium]MDX6322198.1 type transport system permease protein [Propionibacteriaceae bacterium]